MTNKKKIKMFIELEGILYPEAYEELTESISSFDGWIKEITVAFPVVSSDFGKEISITNNGRLKRFEAKDDWKTIWEYKN